MCIRDRARSAKETGAYVIGVYDEHKQQATDELKAIVDHFIMDYADLLDVTPRAPHHR